MNKILIAEDEIPIASFLEKSLRANGFMTAVAKDGDEAIQMSCSHKFDLLILDLSLPGKDGTLVMEQLRGQGERLPIIVLTARDDIKDKVAALEGGADDYVTKPFRIEELLARVRLRLRDRQVHEPARKPEVVRKVGNIVLDLPKRQVKVGDRTVQLSNREFILLDTFVRHADQVLSREDLLNYVWGYDYDRCFNVVDVYVGYLRKKLGNDLIETVRGMGYQLRI
ncbi:MAG: response regulator transcription factor [Fischerella sp.]|uniref:response regulator transcription factor n=1 Tax=unclassified Fischerella TaxID=494603 RepID=UPI0004796A40|nr:MULTISPECIES: response regulator transcription factor [unclassified Fischerella]NWF58057.1 response regulator transcription factor [Fischerella sp.]